MQIYKHRGVDCSAGGISSRFDDVKVLAEKDPSAPDDCVVILEDVVWDKPRIRAVPANSGDKWAMFGGSFLYTSNRVCKHAGTPIPLHDRFE